MKSSMSSLTFCLCFRQTSSACQKGTSAAPGLQSGPGIQAGENHCHHQNYPSVRDGRVGCGLTEVSESCWLDWEHSRDPSQDTRSCCVWSLGWWGCIFLHLNCVSWGNMWNRPSRLCPFGHYSLVSVLPACRQISAACLGVFNQACLH